MRMTIRQKKMAMSNLALALDKCMKKQLDKPAVATHLPAAQVFNQQRRDLMKLHTNNVMAIEVLHSYLMQLKAIVEVFPVSKGGLDVDFQWHNSFEDADFAKQASVAFEEAAVFFNMGAVLTTLASLSTRGTADGLKVSHGYFRNAVAIYSHLRRTLAPMLVKPLTNDLCPEGLDLCHATCVAQAQECFYERACMLSSNLALRAKIAAGSATCYKTMLRCSKPAGTLSKQLHPTWRIFASFGVCIYQASSCYEMGASMYPIAPADDLEAEVTCPDDSKVGEALGYLQSAQRHLDAAKKELKAFDKYVKDPELHKKAVDLEELLSRHLRITTSDNQVVYFQKVPEEAALPEIESKVVVKEPSIEEVLAELVPADKPFARPFQALIDACSEANLVRGSSGGMAAAPEPAAAVKGGKGVDDALLSQMVDMGFDSKKSAAALKKTKNDLNAAVAELTK